MTLLDEKEAAAIEFLRALERPEGYYLAFSGGKDSVVIKHLAEKAGVKFEAVYRVTSVDPPELVRFIKEQHPDVRREIPHDKDGKPVTMWSTCKKHKMLPRRNVRFCCADLKESGGTGKLTITGVRWAESVRRAQNQGKATICSEKTGLEEHPDFKPVKRGGVILLNDNEESRRQIETCYKKHRTVINPIIDWDDADVWTYIKREKIPYCSLYDEGFRRLGCIGCPMARPAERAVEFQRWPKYKEQYIRVAEAIGKERARLGMRLWFASGAEYFKFWTEDPNLPGQLSIFDEHTEEEEEE